MYIDMQSFELLLSAEAYIPPEDMKSCVKKVAQYYFNPDITRWKGKTECEIRNLNCSR